MKRLAAAIFVLGSLWAVQAEDLSKYRDFSFGADLGTIAKQAGVDPSRARMLHSRPALMQELAWRPQAQPVKEVVFIFFDGELYKISVSYDRHETEGLTADDLVGAISGRYGASSKPAAPSTAPSFGEQDEGIAQWQDAQYRFELIKASYGPEFKLVGVLKRLEQPARSANLEAARLDQKEAPEREAARIASADDAERVRLAQARLVNKPKFRPEER
jgi:hypothetical protein